VNKATGYGLYDRIQSLVGAGILSADRHRRMCPDQWVKGFFTWE